MSKPAHNYHLVDPSPLPIMATISLFILAIGALMYMHEKPHGELVLAGGFLVVALTLFKWWRQVIIEGIRDKAHTGVVQDGLRLGMILFIASEAMFFFAFFVSFFKASIFPVDVLDGVWFAKEGVWPPEGIQTFDPWDLPFINTLILILSSVTTNIAHIGMVKGDRKLLIKMLAITVALGVLFTCLQVVEYGHAMFGFTDGIYASNFYMATGFHGAHVIIGTIFLAICLIRAISGTLTKENHLGLEFAAWYWHFVDVVWVFLFVWVYIWGA